MSPVRRLAAIRLVWAALLLTRPGTVLTLALASRERRSPMARRVVKILGLRNLAQACAELFWPRPVLLAAAALVDALHAVSFLSVAALRPDRRWRRAVLLNVITASTFSAATMTARHRTLAVSHRNDGPRERTVTSNGPHEARESRR